MSTNAKKQLVVKASDFQLITRHLYKLGPDEILRWSVLPHEQGKILAEAHVGVVSGNYGGWATMRKALHLGIWWPTLHNDATDYVRSCGVCQHIRKPSRRDEMFLLP